MGPDSPAWHAVFGLDAPWSPAHFAALGDAPLLVLRAVLLVAAAWALASSKVSGPRDLLKFTAIGALAVASLVWQAILAPAALLGLLILCTFASWALRTTIAAVATVAVLLIAASVWPRASPIAASTGSPPAETTRALERGNLYEARFWAARWARMEGDDPRDGALIWARVEDQAGHVDLARRIAADVAARSHTESVRSRARAQLASFAEAKK